MNKRGLKTKELWKNPDCRLCHFKTSNYGRPKSI